MRKIIYLSFILSFSFSCFSATYKYDDSNKLQQVTYDNVTVVSYEYDADGNLLKVTPTESSFGGGDIGVGTDNGGTDNETSETPEPEKKKSGGSFGFGLFFLVLSFSFFRRFNRK
jgi:YD repeat-containing protein